MLSQRADEAAAFARAAVTDAQDFTNAHAVFLPSTARCSSNVRLASTLMGGRSLN